MEKSATFSGHSYYSHVSSLNRPEKHELQIQVRRTTSTSSTAADWWQVNPHPMTIRHAPRHHVTTTLRHCRRMRRKSTSVPSERFYAGKSQKYSARFCAARRYGAVNCNNIHGKQPWHPLVPRVFRGQSRWKFRGKSNISYLHVRLVSRHCVWPKSGSIHR